MNDGPREVRERDVPYAGEPGMGAILGNIPLVAQALGSGPTLAGTVVIAAFAADAIYGEWDKVAAALGAPITQVTTEDIRSDH